MKWVALLSMFLLSCSPPPTLRVVFFGDSITVGYDDIIFDQSVLDGFRPATAANLLAKGAQANWVYVGNILGANATPQTKVYQATSGATIQLRTSDLGTYFGSHAIAQGQGVAGGCTNVQVGRSLLGTNNVVPDPLATTANYTAFCDAFFLAFPNGALSVGRIPRCRANLGFTATIDQMNTDIAAVVATQVGLGRAVIFEADAGLVDADYAAGGVHLIASGNAKMAVVAANGIYAAAQLRALIP